MHRLRNRSYEELILLDSFEERFEYLKLWNEPHIAPNQVAYMSALKTKRWLDFRDEMIFRDYAKDLAVENRFIYDKVIVHHMQPITPEDVYFTDEGLLVIAERMFDPNEVITTSHDTHNRLHYKSIKGPEVCLERSKGDTTLW